MEDSSLTTERSFQPPTARRGDEMSSTKPKAYLFVFDGLADWEPALALCEIRKCGKYEVLTVGRSREPVVTMAGLRIVPDVTMHEIDPAATAIFILPGGNQWEEGPDQKIDSFIRQLHTERSSSALYAPLRWKSPAPG